MIVLAAFRSPASAFSAALGTVLAALALSCGPAVQHAARNWSPPAVMGIALGAYAGTVTLGGAVYLALGAVDWLVGEQVAAGLIGATAAGVAGQVRAVARLRSLAFGSSAEARDDGFPG